jgi:predicted esterase
MTTPPRLILIPTTTHGRVLVREGTGSDLLIGFHGYAETADEQLARMGRIPAAANWTLASVQGLNRFYRGRTQDVVAGWMTRQDRETAISDNVAFVDRTVEKLRASCGERGRLVFAGFSQGTAMAYRAAVLGKSRASGIIAVGGDVPPELLADPGNDFPPVLIVRGERDDWYTQAKLDEDVAALEKRGVRVTAVVSDAAHEWTSLVDRHADEFLRNLQLPL